MSTMHALDPQIRRMLEAMAGMGVRPIEELTVAEAREQVETTSRLRPRSGTSIGEVVNLSVAVSPEVRIDARLYRPEGDGPHPLILYFHGGGHVIGSIDTHDDTALNYAAATGAVVISVAYRMAPEHRFPTAVDDAYASLIWAYDNADELCIDQTRIAVTGDSAGANLATVVALIARDRGGPKVCCQALIYPVTDYRLQAKSFETFAQGYGVLSAKAMHWFRSHYLASPSDASDWRASPVLADLVGTAPAIIVAADCDPLIDDIRAYVDKLREQGVPTMYREYPGMVHGFFSMAQSVDVAAQAQRETFATVQEMLALNRASARKNSSTVRAQETEDE
jgi:acetyl esterase